MKEKADRILTGNNIFISAKSNIISGFVAIKGEKIIAVENDKSLIPEYSSATTELIDCGDGLIMPGFHDCHVHIIQGGIFERGVPLSDCTSEEEAASRVGKYAEENPDMPWILGCGWYQIYWDRQELPTRKSLDKYVSDRPVFLENEDGHGAWVNSKALEMCGITSETKDPEFGEIFRDADGEPTGYLDELAMLLCGAKAYDLPVEYESQLLRDFLDKSVENGITSVNDMRPFFNMDLGRLSTYEYFEKNGDLPVRINFASNLFDLNTAKKLKQGYKGGKLNYFGLKEFIDGVAISYTSYLLEDYSDRENCKGYTLIEEEKLDKAIADAQKEGIPVHLHVTGDAAVRLSLDSFEKARKLHGNNNIRHSLEHIDLIAPEDIRRLNEMKIIASMQPEHMAPTESFTENPYTDRFGTARSRYAWAIKSIMDSGADVAFGTDFPVAGLNPMEGLKRAVTRKFDDGTPENGWNPQEKISVTEALGAYTLGSAKMAGREDEMGTLEKGKYADIAVLDKNPVTADPNEINKIKVVCTICNGEVTYSGNNSERPE